MSEQLFPLHRRKLKHFFNIFIRSIKKKLTFQSKQMNRILRKEHLSIPEELKIIKVLLTLSR